MRWRDVLKVGLICVAILVGAKIMWERLVDREANIRAVMHATLDNVPDRLGMDEALIYADDVMDLTFSTVLLQELGEDLCEYGLQYIGEADSFVQYSGQDALTNDEKALIMCVCNMICDNYAHQVSEDALVVLLSIGVSAKIYQLRPGLDLREVE